MFYYAQLDQTNKVVAVSATDRNIELHSGLVPCNADSLNKIYDAGTNTFTTASDANTYLTVTAPTAPVAVGAQIHITVEVKDAQGNHVPVVNTYYVPIICISDNNRQEAFLALNFTNGTANVVFTVGTAGIYSVNMGLISPTPSSILSDNVKIIVI